MSSSSTSSSPQRPVILQPTVATIAAAAQSLRAGKLVAFPTETVYGLGARATSEEACAAIYEAKGRPSFNPLIVHFATSEKAQEAVVFNSKAHALSKAFWPGPLTLVLPKRSDCFIAERCSPGLDSLAVRIPAHPLAQALLQSCHFPLAAPSANASGKISPTTAEHVAQSLAGSGLEQVLDGGPCSLGLESSVLDLTEEENPILLRPGTLGREAVEALIGPITLQVSLMERQEQKAFPCSGSSDPVFPVSVFRCLVSPGLLKSHYAPSLPVRLNATCVSGQEALLAFGSTPLKGAAVSVNLSETGDLHEAARNLFNALHQLDKAGKEKGLSTLAVMPLPHEGAGIALNDRLRRAAASK